VPIVLVTKGTVHSSVALGVPGEPPANQADVLEPADVPLYLALDKSATSVQLVPFQDSVTAVLPGGPRRPPKASAAVLEFAATLGPSLLVFKLLTSVQDVPSQVSVLAVLPEPGCPPATIADVDNPPPPSKVLPSFKSLTSVHELPSHNSVASL